MEDSSLELIDVIAMQEFASGKRSMQMKDVIYSYTRYDTDILIEYPPEIL